jgi:DNA-binding NarL/FixJ family response regulator
MLLFPWTWATPLVGSCQAQKTLQDLTSSYGTNQIKNEAQLTSREVEICDMIKNGISGK